MKIEIHASTLNFVLTVLLVVGAFFLGRMNFRQEFTQIYQRWAEECGLPDEPVFEWQQGICINGFGVDQINLKLFGVEH